LNDPADPNSPNYQGYTVVDSLDEVIPMPPKGELSFPPTLYSAKLLGSSDYRFQISLNATFNSLEYDETQDSNIFVPDDWVPSNGIGIYYFRVMAKKNGIWGNWSSGQVFNLSTTNNPPNTDNPIRDGLVGEWLFSGNALDTSENSNNGIVIGATLAIDRNGNSNSAYYFNGSTYIRVPDSPDLNFTSSMTLAAWYFCDSFSTTWPPILKKTGIGASEDGGYTLEMNASPVWGDGTSGPAIIFISDSENVNWAGANGHMSTEGWHFVAGTYDGSSMKLYYDGVLVKSNAYSGNLIPSTNDLNIGRDPFRTERYFNGRIDDIRIYSRALTADEIVTLYESD
jgi:hypothetical protein